MRPLTILLLLFAWQSSAEAFFCFTFGGHGHARHDSRFDTRAWQPPPPPPQLLTPYALVQEGSVNSAAGDDLPPIRGTKKSPELIQGYRFRPLDRDNPRPALLTPADWRD